MKYLYIGIGGMIGALARYTLGKWLSRRWKGTFPIGTFVINLSGAFTLGLMVGLFARFFPSYTNLKVMITTGFLGAYTTFSTFTYETVRLIEDGEYFQAARYVLLSIIVGILLAFGAVLTAEYV